MQIKYKNLEVEDPKLKVMGDVYRFKELENSGSLKKSINKEVFEKAKSQNSTSAHAIAFFNNLKKDDILVVMYSC